MGNSKSKQQTQNIYVSDYAKTDDNKFSDFYFDHADTDQPIEYKPKKIIKPKSEWIIMSAHVSKLELTSNLSLILNNTGINQSTTSTYVHSIPYIPIEYDWKDVKQQFITYKDKAQQRVNTMATLYKPEHRVFIVGEHYTHWKNKLSKTQLLSDNLRKQLLNQLNKLSQDKRVRYDIREANSCQFISSQKPNLFGPKYGQNIRNDSILIHDLIDPFKYVYNYALWLPAIFNVNKVSEKCIIESEILNLNRVKYYKLYDLIGDIFYRIHPLFENILHRRLHKEKVIVKSMKYILSKPGDIYLGRMHREGMGENIECVAIYYPHVDKKIIGGQLELIVIDRLFKQRKIKIYAQEGDLIIFRNECFHRLVGMQYPGKIDVNDEEKEYKLLTRTILVFFLINPKEQIVTTENITPMNSTYSRLDINLSFNTTNIINYWIRLYYINDKQAFFNHNVFELTFMYNLVELYICGDEKYVYNKRKEFRKNRFCSMKLPQPKDYRDSFQEMFLNEPVVDEGVPLNHNVSPDENPFLDFYFDHTRDEGVPQRSLIQAQNHNVSPDENPYLDFYFDHKQQHNK
eukprot:181501_1